MLTVMPCKLMFALSCGFLSSLVLADLMQILHDIV